MQKPPTQYAVAQGIATSQAAQEWLPIPRHKLAGLPPFQMFAAEKGKPAAALVVQDDAVREYIAWHAAKAYWAGETPFGELL